MSTPLVSISVIQPIKLLKIPKRQVTRWLYPVLRAFWFRKSQSNPDQFFSMTINEIELSIFAASDVIDSMFGHYLPSDVLAISSEEWVALQVEQHGDVLDESGIRVREISAPLAAQGISILFQSTYINDFILIKKRRLEQCIEILQAEGFIFTTDSPPDAMEDSGYDATTSPSTPIGDKQQMTRSITGSLLLKESPASRHLSGVSEPVHMSPSPSRSREPLDTLYNDLGSQDPLHSTAEDQPRSFEDNPAMTDSASSETFMLDLANKLSLLPDELICVGLNVQNENVWSELVVKACFFSDQVLGSLSDASALPEASPKRSPVATFADTTPRQSQVLTPSTQASDPPVPFVSFTATNDGCSLTADIRVLRKLFADHYDAGIVYTAGGTSLADLFEGEEEQVLSPVGEPMQYERGRSMTRQLSDDDWTSVSPPVSESERKVLKCLQLDLSSFGLDKTGIVNVVTQLLTSHGINLLYSSTYSTANILVAKGDYLKARIAFEGKITAREDEH